MEQQVSGASPDGDRAVVNGAASVSALRASVPSACCNCQYWRRNAYREPSPEPETHGKIFGFRFARDPFLVRVDRSIRSFEIESNESGLCRRFPDCARTHETHYCGEFAQAIEARRAETLGSVHESAVPEGNAP